MPKILNISNKIILETLPLVEPYGVEWDVNEATTAMTRIGPAQLHHGTTGLPIQNNMRRCLLLDNGTVNYYLDPSDSTKKLNGTASILDGTDGQVMVEIPAHFRRFDTDGTKRRVYLSTGPFEGSHQVPRYYISAYEASLSRSNSRLSSVINLSTNFRGGNNTSAWDSDSRSLLGMPATSITRTNFLAFARNRGLTWHNYLYQIHKAMFWLFTVEYATKNTQQGYTPSLSEGGLRQGGLGTGVTNIVAATWSSFNSSNPFVRCGSGEPNNYTSEKAIVHPTLGVTQVPQYRGIEHPFGHVWKWSEGVNIRAGAGKNMIYKAQSFTFSDVDYNNYDYLGDMAVVNGFIRDISFGISGDLFPISTSGASATTFWSDQLFQSVPAVEALRGLILGGRANYGSAAGLVCAFADGDPSNATTGIGSRLCFAEVLGA